MQEQKKPKNVAPAVEQNLKFMRDKERQKVRGKFIYHEVPGGQVEFMFKKYKGDPLEKFSMVDGQIYSVPLGVARHLNKNVSYDTYKYTNDEQGRPTMTISEKVRRCSFQSLEFVDIDGVSNEIGSALPR